MPGHRKRRQFKQTDAFTRGMVIGLKRAGWSIRQIAADTHLGASTVHRLWRRWLEQGNAAIYRNVGATRVTSARVDRRILREAVAAPQATCTAILQHVQDTLDHSISTRTISRRLVANGLHTCRPLRRLPLTPPNISQRLEWCRARSTWMKEWHRVVFSDESRFCLSSDSRRVRMWRRRGERSNPAAIVECPTVRQRGIMVWGAIAYDSRSPLLRIQGTLTAQRYVDDVLRPVTLPYLQGVPNALYQQDNARPHTARISQQALQDVQMLPWPPYSPDLSPIEHVWDIIGRRLHALPQPRSEDEQLQHSEGKQEQNRRQKFVKPSRIFQEAHRRKRYTLTNCSTVRESRSRTGDRRQKFVEPSRIFKEAHRRRRYSKSRQDPPSQISRQDLITVKVDRITTTKDDHNEEGKKPVQMEATKSKDRGTSPPPVKRNDRSISPPTRDYISGASNLPLQRHSRGSRKITRTIAEKDANLTNLHEIKALLGIIYFLGVMKANKLNTDDAWARDSTGFELCRIAMSENRFRFLLRVIRFDDKATRNERLRQDKLAAVRLILDTFVKNYQKHYSPSEYITVDEKLDAFRGKCNFRQYIPSKHNKNGIKLFALVNSKFFYTCNLEIYSGKNPEGPYNVSNSPSDVVERLCEPISH
ncbi:hypothetical protein LAZ67_X002594 [Cordylochernes scorpioides]|uniref:Transposase n=1 Tax=Cordylochernes scorpioides TaxID=51811 RepID=A0ABY6LTH3_9ARAC|nr:hypothetical protein LAZ67_X002594 [Cordylochernes scorpioides]